MAADAILYAVYRNALNSVLQLLIGNFAFVLELQNNSEGLKLISQYTNASLIFRLVIWVRKWTKTIWPLTTMRLLIRFMSQTWNEFLILIEIFFSAVILYFSNTRTN